MGRECVSGPLLSPEVLSANGAVVAAARGQLEEGALDGYAARGAGQRSRRGSPNTGRGNLQPSLYRARHVASGGMHTVLLAPQLGQ